MAHSVYYTYDDTAVYWRSKRLAVTDSMTNHVHPAESAMSFTQGRMIFLKGGDIYA